MAHCNFCDELVKSFSDALALTELPPEDAANIIELHIRELAQWLVMQAEERARDIRIKED